VIAGGRGQTTLQRSALLRFIAALPHGGRHLPAGPIPTVLGSMRVDAVGAVRCRVRHDGVGPGDPARQRGWLRDVLPGAARRCGRVGRRAAQ